MQCCTLNRIRKECIIKMKKLITIKLLVMSAILTLIPIQEKVNAMDSKEADSQINASHFRLLRPPSALPPSARKTKVEQKSQPTPTVPRRSRRPKQPPNAQSVPVIWLNEILKLKYDFLSSDTLEELKNFFVKTYQQDGFFQQYQQLANPKIFPTEESFVALINGIRTTPAFLNCPSAVLKEFIETTLRPNVRPATSETNDNFKNFMLDVCNILDYSFPLFLSKHLHILTFENKENNSDEEIQTFTDESLSSAKDLIPIKAKLIIRNRKANAVQVEFQTKDNLLSTSWIAMDVYSNLPKIQGEENALSPSQQSAKTPSEKIEEIKKQFRSEIMSERFYHDNEANGPTHSRRDELADLYPQEVVKTPRPYQKLSFHDIQDVELRVAIEQRNNSEILYTCTNQAAYYYNLLQKNGIQCWRIHMVGEKNWEPDATREGEPLRGARDFDHHAYAHEVVLYIGADSKPYVLDFCMGNDYKRTSASYKQIRLNTFMGNGYAESTGICDEDVIRLASEIPFDDFVKACNCWCHMMVVINPLTNDYCDVRDHFDERSAACCKFPKTQISADKRRIRPVIERTPERQNEGWMFSYFN